MTRSAPRARITGTHLAAVSTMSAKTSLPSTLPLSQIATPGLVRPRIPTFSFGAPCPPSRTSLITYGRYAGLPVAALTAFAARAGKPSWPIHFASSGRP